MTFLDKKMRDNSPELDWKEEAQAVIRDIKDFVQEIAVSPELRSNEKVIYMNLTTLEGLKVSIELTALGFQVVGRDYNTNNAEEGTWFDTPYSLLASLSPNYNRKFAEALSKKLEKLTE